jgi:hypothetical protein
MKEGGGGAGPRKKGIKKRWLLRFFFFLLVVAWVERKEMVGGLKNEIKMMILSLFLRLTDRRIEK